MTISRKFPPVLVPIGLVIMEMKKSNKFTDHTDYVDDDRHKVMTIPHMTL